MSSADLRRQVIASRLKEARRLSGLSQAQVAKILDLQRPSVTEMESGNRRVSADELVQLAEIYEVSVSWLSGEGVGVLNPQDDRVQLAARELSKLTDPDLERLLRILASKRRRDAST